MNQLGFPILSLVVWLPALGALLMQDFIRAQGISDAERDAWVPSEATQELIHYRLRHCTDPATYHIGAAAVMIASEGQSLEKIKDEMKDITGDALERRIATSLAPALTSGADNTVERDDQHSYKWRRAPIADGIELHIREDSPAAREEAVIAMREAVRAALGRADIR